MNNSRVWACALLPLGAILLLSGCALPSLVVTAAPKPPVDQAAINREVYHRFIELFGTGKWDEFDEVIATDCVLHYPGGVDVVGLDAMKAGWQTFFAALKDLKVTPLAEVSEGNTLMEFLVIEGTYDGEYLGRKISGVPIKYNNVEMIRVEDGKIAEWWVEMDRLWMAQQLGFELKPKPK